MKPADKILIATSPSDAKLKPSDSFIAGFIAGIAARTASCPLDTVKMLMQTNSHKTSILETCREIIAKDGIKGFWRGNLVGVINAAPLQAIKYTVIDHLQIYLKREYNSTPAERALVGAVAGVISQGVCYPFDLILTRTTVNPDRYHNLFHATKTIILEDGITGLWSGVFPTIVGAIVYEGSQFVVQGGFKQFYTQKEGRVATWRNLFIGACSGAVSQTIAFPFDVMRRRMMIVDSEGKRIYNSYIGCFKSIWEKEGATGFFKGIHVNLFKILPNAAINYTVCEECKNLFLTYRAYQEAKQRNKK
ncbi:Mitochondrial carrier protein [Trichomonas vaginalis G3]|uniref:Mitochondrial carrier protein n=1 Tax=Trichomonas vaginalis (strain ATCC PRA-98 / G3) TaxID=412133 RepID=A2DUD3_TRIV3|nr:mitochondrial transport [Trichomonas vaginalis G3]EAY15971.1 Mitochondrial carrier protein [Trichomonas vaginalis G3]KAI5523606.1 mitochondrial transport [Trichomonas vaginalis G3]|eukprot:XP_001328194.1 Mitochondrial carrier protein [Trichomonas vaginalis G3]